MILNPPPASTNAIDTPSGAHSRFRTPSVPGTASTVSEPRDRTKRRRPKPEKAMNPSRRPSGETGRLLAWRRRTSPSGAATENRIGSAAASGDGPVLRPNTAVARRTPARTPLPTNIAVRRRPRPARSGWSDRSGESGGSGGLTPSSISSRATPTCGRRFRTSRSKQRRSSVRTADGVSAGRASRSSSVLRTAASVSEMSVPPNAWRPVSISNSRTPNAQMSARLST